MSSVSQSTSYLTRAAKWRYELELKQEWSKLLDNFNFLPLLIDKLKASPLYGGGDGFEDLVNELDTSRDVADFDEIWNRFYDYCDARRIWVAIH